LTKYTSSQAIRICERKLQQDFNTVGKGYDCYYYDGRCELGFNCNSRDCMDYVNDVTFTNKVRRNILNDPWWCKHNWELLCRVDKDLFLAIYGTK